MAAGRPPSGAELVDGLDGSGGAKLRLKVVLETLSGTKTIAEATRELGIGETAFYKLRGRWLEDAVRSLEPRQRGRPHKARAQAGSEELSRLREENAELRRAILVGAVREEIAVAMPRIAARWEGKKTRLPPTPESPQD